MVIGVTSSVFGEDVTYLVNGETEPLTISGLFDNAWVEIEGVASFKPTVRIRLSDLPDKPGKGDRITARSVTYRIIESREDSRGGSLLILQRV